MTLVHANEVSASALALAQGRSGSEMNGVEIEEKRLMRRAFHFRYEDWSKVVSLGAIPIKPPTRTGNLGLPAGEVSVVISLSPISPIDSRCPFCIPVRYSDKEIGGADCGLCFALAMAADESGTGDRADRADMGNMGRSAPLRLTERRLISL